MTLSEVGPAPVCEVGAVGSEASEAHSGTRKTRVQTRARVVGPAADFMSIARPERHVGSRSTMASHHRRSSSSKSGGLAAPRIHCRQKQGNVLSPKFRDAGKQTVLLIVTAAPFTWTPRLASSCSASRSKTKYTHSHTRTQTHTKNVTAFQRRTLLSASVPTLKAKKKNKIDRDRARRALAATNTSESPPARSQATRRARDALGFLPVSAVAATPAARREKMW